MGLLGPAGGAAGPGLLEDDVVLDGFEGHIQAHGAIAAPIGSPFPKIVQDKGAQTPAAGGVKGHLPQPVQVPLAQQAALGLVQVRVVLAVLDEPPGGDYVLAAVKQHAFRRAAVPPRPARLLVVAFQVLGHVVVDHIGYVGLVDAHAEGVGGHHDGPAVVLKVGLVFLALLVGEPRVIAGSRISRQAQLVAHLLHRLAGGAVHDAAALGMPLHHFQ